MTEVNFIKCEEFVLMFNDSGVTFNSVNAKYHAKGIGWTDGYITLVDKGVAKMAYFDYCQLDGLPELSYVL